MDTVTAALLPNHSSRKPSKISGVFHRLAKACKLATPTSFVTPGAGGVKAAPDCSTNETEASSDEAHHGKIHPQPPSVVTLDHSNASCSSTSTSIVDDELSRVVLTQLLDAVSSLKLAYLEFQKSHVIYDPEKLQSANEELLAQLETISDIELFYNEKRRDKKKPPKPSKSKSALVDARSAASTAPPSCTKEIAEYQSLLDKLHALVRAKDADALQLRWTVEDLRARNAEMEEEISRNRTPEEEVECLLLGSCPESSVGSASARPELLKLVHEHAARSIHEFGKPLIGLMMACGWDLDRAAESAITTMRLSAVTFTQRSHKKYVFEAYLSRILFTSPELGEAEAGATDEEVATIMRFHDPLDTLASHPSSSFARFCSSKYLLAVHPAMERSFFGNLDQRAFVLRGGHPRTPFYRAFARMARWAWTLKALLSAAGGAARCGGLRMFWVESGRCFQDEHMQSVCVEGGDQEGGSSNGMVGFTIVPGFRFNENRGDSVMVRCKVYASR